MGAWIVARRELASLLNSPIASIAAVAYLLFTGIWLFFLNHFFAQNEASLRLYFNVVPVVFAVLLPALTMRSWAEERRSGTLELLLTLPFREGELVLGKFLGIMLLLCILLVLSLALPLSLAPLGAFDPGQLAGQYLGTLMIGASGIAAGLFISSLCTSQPSAFVLSALLVLALTLAGPAAVMISLPSWLAGALSFASFSFHFDSFKKGLLDSRDVLYFLAVTGLFLFLNRQALAGRKES
jgi:ABC-2 type transport system permease protein